MYPIITPEFKASLNNTEQFPCNLCEPHTYRTTLEGQRDRLSKSAIDLFIENHSKIQLPVRDLVPTVQDPSRYEFQESKLLSSAELKLWIGDRSLVNPLHLVTKRDPLVRFIFPFAADSRSPLKCTKEMLLQVLSYHQVMPAFLEFLLLFGRQTRPMDLRFSGFREETVLDTPGVGLDMHSLNRSGIQFELCYNLKGVTEKSSGNWSVRHVAIYHKFDVTFGTSLWLIVKGSLDLKKRIEPIADDQCKEQDRHFQSIPARFESSLAIHLLTAHWAGESWRWYLQNTEDEVEKFTEAARFEDYDEKASNPAEVKRYTSRDLQDIQAFSEKASEAATILESNVEVLTALRKYYEELVANHRIFFGPGFQNSVSRLSRQLNNIIYDLKMQKSRAGLLVQEIQSRKELILQHMQSQNSRSMEELTIATYQVTKVAQQDAIAIRIITVVTLFYLPATFVSSFFSTDVVKYQNQNAFPVDSNTSFSVIALSRWFQVTLPLTAITLICAYLGYLWAKRSVKKHEQFELVPV